LSEGYPGTLYFRNAPTLLNCGVAKRFMWDGRLDGADPTTLVRDMITEAHTMNMDSRLMQERVKQVPEYVKRWKEIFGNDAEPYGPKLYGVVAEYIKTIRSDPSPVDAFIEGASDALTEAAKRGMTLFVGKAQCIQCHDGSELSNGALHATGVPENPILWDTPERAITLLRYYASSGVPNYMNLRSDVGYFAVSKQERDKGKFRTPSLRDLAHTAPYMHNGVFATLEEVISFYDEGGGKAENKDDVLKPLHLTDEEKHDLAVFLRSATGELPTVEPPVLPEYEVREFGKN
jgi:cytochrome c peroxidase